MSDQVLDKPKGFDLQAERGEFDSIRRSQKFVNRNYSYWLYRQAMDGRFRWPVEWPNHKPKLVHNMVKRVVLSMTSLLMGRQFSIQVPPLDEGLEARKQAQIVEKILYKHIDKSGGWGIFNAGAQDGSLLGSSIFKTYIDPKTKWTTISQCQPDYFYGIPSSSNYLTDFSKVYYFHYIDKLEARRLYGDKDYKTDAELGQQWDTYSRASGIPDDVVKRRQVSHLEIWTEDSYALVVGGEVIYNAENPYGFIPYVCVPNIRITGQVEGKGDIDDVLSINEELNRVLSERSYIVRRWLNPTVVWEGAPINYSELIQKIVGGGGVLPTRLGGKIYFLAHQGQGPDVVELLERLRRVILENANTTELALTGNVTGSINTGSSLDKQLLSLLFLIEMKRLWWSMGLERLFSQVLQLASQSEAIDEYGAAHINVEKSQATGQFVRLTKDSIGDYRDVTVVWPSALARDDAAATQLELSKHQAGVQSLYSTMERLGVDFPDDEIERIAEERSDPRLAPKENAALLDAASPLLAQQQQLAAQQQAQGGGGEVPPAEPTTPPARKPAKKKPANDNTTTDITYGPDGEPVIA